MIVTISEQLVYPKVSAEGTTKYTKYTKEGSAGPFAPIPLRRWRGPLYLFVAFHEFVANRSSEFYETQRMVHST